MDATWRDEKLVRHPITQRRAHFYLRIKEKLLVIKGLWFLFIQEYLKASLINGKAKNISVTKREGMNKWEDKDLSFRTIVTWI